MRRLLPFLPLLALSACRSSAPEPTPPPVETESVQPGINEMWVDPELDAERARQILEVESREVYSARHEVVRALELAPGEVIADLGAGTGLYTWLFADAVGEGGRVLAVELSVPLVEHLGATAQARGRANVQAVQCTERSCELEPDSVDAIFVCDTYHHFEYPLSVLWSMRSALREGGRLYVLDFERIPGVSREWIFGHVRLGKQETIDEIELQGFRLERELEVGGLEENYLLRFVTD